MTDLETVYRTYFDDVYAYIRRLSGDAYIANQLTSEIFTKAMRSIDGLRSACDIQV